MIYNGLITLRHCGFPFAEIGVVSGGGTVMEKMGCTDFFLRSREGLKRNAERSGSEPRGKTTARQVWARNVRIRTNACVRVLSNNEITYWLKKIRHLEYRSEYIELLEWCPKNTKFIPHHEVR